MRWISTACLAFGCASAEGTWVGATEVDIFGTLVPHELDVTFVEGTTQTGERALEGGGWVRQRDVVHDVAVQGPWRGRRVRVDLPLEETFYAFGQSLQGHEPGGGSVHVSLAFALDGRARRRRWVGRLVVEQHGDVWDAPLELERVE